MNSPVPFFHQCRKLEVPFMGGGGVGWGGVGWGGVGWGGVGWGGQPHQTLLSDDI